MEIPQITAYKGKQPNAMENCQSCFLDEEYSRGVVSVIIPSYNRSHFIIMALDSVWAQSYRPIEIVIIDDGSTDDTRRIVEEWRSKLVANENCRLYYYYQRNKGPSAARNLGLSKSNGEYVQFLDSDDFLHPEKLKSHIDVFNKNPHIDVTVSQVAYIDQNGNHGYITNIIEDTNKKVDMPTFLLGHDIPIHAPLHRHRTLADIGGFDEKLTFGEEVDFHLRLALTGAKFIFMPDVFAYVPSHKDSERVSQRLHALSSNFEINFYVNILEYCKIQSYYNLEFQEALAKRLLGAADKNFSRWRIRRGLLCLQTAEKIWPQSIKSLGRLYLSPGGGIVAALIESLLNIAKKIIRRTGFLA
jgi:glycosyltransferase involved in cell wall biosynthesis